MAEWSIQEILSVLVALVVVGALAFRRSHGFRWPALPHRRPPAPASALPPLARVEPAPPQPPQPAPAPPDTPDTRLRAVAAEIGDYDDLSDASELSLQPKFLALVQAVARESLPLSQLVAYATGDDLLLSCAALVVLAERPDRESEVSRILTHFAHYAAWPIFFALYYLSTLEKRPPAGAPFTYAQRWWESSPEVAEEFRLYFINLNKLGAPATFGHYIGLVESEVPAILDKINHPYARALKQEYQDWLDSRLDENFLRSVGRIWTNDSRLVTPFAWLEALDRAELAIRNRPPRSVLVSGEPRIGKTSFLKLLARAVDSDEWRVFEASGAEVMAGQFYIGQIEGRVRELVKHLDAKKRVVWYCGDLLQLADSGTHRGQAQSLLDQILPAITSGRLVMLSETSPAGAARLLQFYPALRAATEICRLEPFSDAEARVLLDKIAAHFPDRHGLEMSDDVIPTLLQLSQQYLGDRLPGNALDLLNRAAAHATATGGTTIDSGSVIATLSQMTGLPVAILDEKQRVDLKAARAFFGSRVIGQSEAVEAVVNRIAMLKAGLTDPSRPIGVFLFAGPTGTGKTELARTLAEFLFGAPERMTRLDMSEFQTAESLGKIIGERGYVSNSLAESVRKEPFCVLLLDEFEKAHPNIWDLFLQIFDDGRLTDANGRVADFRHALIILTSNLGATGHQTSGLGFLPGASAYTEDHVTKAIARAFRPEFVNRLDRVIVFKPLTRDVMREILHKELNRVLRRRGLNRREWAVEWESSAIEFLLDRGFSPDMGARPLKRAIDEYLLAPLAATLVEQQFPEGDQFLFVRSNGHKIEVEFVNPDEDESGPAPAVPAANVVSLASMILQPAGSADEREALAQIASDVKARISSPEWLQQKEALADDVSRPEIWSRPERHALFARLALIDRVETQSQSAERLYRRFDYGATNRHLSRDLMSRVALQFHLTEQGMADALEGAPVDVLLVCEPALDGADSAGSKEWPARLLEMYRQWATARHMSVAEHLHQGRVILEIGGFGAWRALQHEAGLHVFDDEKGRRVAARVKVAPGPAEQPKPGDAARIFSGALAAAAETSTIIRRYREKPAPLVRDSRLGWRTGRIDTVLNGNFDLIAALLRDES